MIRMNHRGTTFIFPFTIKSPKCCLLPWRDFLFSGLGLESTQLWHSVGFYQTGQIKGPDHALLHYGKCRINNTVILLYGLLYTFKGVHDILSSSSGWFRVVVVIRLYGPSPLEAVFCRLSAHSPCWWSTGCYCRHMMQSCWISSHYCGCIYTPLICICCACFWWART